MSKYSLRNIMLGVGIGLVISSIVNINASQQHLSLDELKKEAERYNMTLVSSEIEKSYIDTEPTVTPTIEETVTPEPEEYQDQSKVEVIFKIKSGSNSYIVADDLIKAGLIEDKEEFLNRLFEVHKDNKLQTGTFNIEKGLDYDSIIKILTSIH